MMIRLLLCFMFAICLTKADDDFFLDESDVPYLTEAEIYSDPLEKVNRVSFKIMLLGNRFVMLPLANAYNFTVPRFLHIHFRTFIQNTREPLNIINAVLVPHKPNAVNSLSRFLFNTTFGIFSFFDIYGQYNEPTINIGLDDIAQYYSKKPLPYLVIPPISAGNIFISADLLEPTLLANKLLSEDYADSMFALSFMISLVAVHANKVEIQDTMDNSIDPYSILRTVYYQLQQNKINNISKAPTRSSYTDLLPDSFL